MDFIDQIKTIAQRIEKVKDKVTNEEATKTSFIIPFIESLGYDIYNPGEVIPEYTADIPVLKNDKVDYAILLEGKPTILIECKCCHDTLDNYKHTAQLHRYFKNTEARFGILTNGIIYRFYTDIDTGHVMDKKPFFEFNLTKFNDSDINELKKFSKTHFDSNALNNTAQNLLYTKEIKRLITEQFANPSAELVKVFACQIYNKRMTGNAIEMFTEITKQSFKEFINERIAERLKSAMDNVEEQDSPKESTEESEEALNIDNEIVTTEEELEGFYIVKSVLREVLDVSHLKFKDTRSYFGINLHGKSSQTVCRLYFNSRKKYIGIIDTNGKEAKKEISNLDEIYGLAKFLKDRIIYLTQSKYIVKAE